MPDLSLLDPALDPKAMTCRAVIESPKGSPVKYAYDSKAQAFELKRILPAGMAFPLDFGFVPSTMAEDGDPLDILVLNDEPAVVGALVTARLIGVIEGEQTEEGKTFRNDRVLAVAQVSHLFEKITAAEDLPERVLRNLTQFWVNYGALRGATFKVLGARGPDEAVRAIQAAMR
ncbi:MAG: Inorganic pyrophosphatase [Phenylobacterium sp.]|jgi:inorganic pyrophosphatase|uniref:inorganic diphosphatase n=1 Tax=Phenylobacterium sp. TaxID=1871053 RepID=UPI00261E90C9|nr:inorganic diphosphatase [Phenylobacterium sp.]MDB5436521.1 Inorganic pyrophosphatase [Phenylobacterium sp.]MDB5499596.1 Inorganic pyrophosphatase [Phenylobacterium sp.]